MGFWDFYVIYVILYFSSRGILIDQFGFDGIVDYIFSTILRGISFIYLFRELFIEGVVKNIRYILFVMLMICLVSFFVNLKQESILQLVVFLTLTFYPIGFALIIINELNIANARKVIFILALWMLLQYIYSIINNYSSLLSDLIVDDPFNGFFSFPRAYNFSYFSLSISALLFLTKDNLFFNKKIHSFLMLLFLTTPVLAGAGRIVSAIMVSFLFLVFFNSKITSKLLMSILVGFILPLYNLYVSFFSSTEEAFSDLIENPLTNPKAIHFFESFNPLLDDPIYFLIGFGPANYMSSGAMQFRPDLVYWYNDSLHDLYSTDAYQAFNNSIGFIGDVGIFFLILYYRFVLFFCFKAVSGLSRSKKMVLFLFITMSFVLSFLFHVFDDPYYSITFWMFIALTIKIASVYKFKGSYE